MLSSALDATRISNLPEPVAAPRPSTVRPSEPQRRRAGARGVAVEAVNPIVRRAQDGDETAFRELFLRHRTDVARIVFRVIGPSSDIDDVVQDAFVHVYRSLPSFRGESKFSTWLYRLTVNVARMHLRRGRSRPQTVDVAVPEAPRGDTPAGDNPEEAIERADRVRTLYRLLDSLSEKKRAVLVMHDLEGVSASEIAEVVEAPVLTVRTRLFYARKELFEAIAREPSLAAIAAELLPALKGKPSEQPAAATPSDPARPRPRRDSASAEVEQ